MWEQTDPAGVVGHSSGRRGWPWWVWALLIGLPLLTVSAIAAVLLANIVLGQATQAVYCFADGKCNLREGPEPTPVVPESSVDEGAATKRVPLDGHAVFDGQPVWSLKLEPTWQTLSFDQDGINVFQDEATGCQLITSQRLALPDPDALGDGVMSDALLFREILGFTADDPEALVLESAFTDVSIGEPDSGSTIEFAAATIARTNSEGVPEIIEMIARSMPDSEGELVAGLTCEADAHETFDSKYELFTKVLSVSVGP